MERVDRDADLLRGKLLGEVECLGQGGQNRPIGAVHGMQGFQRELDAALTGIRRELGDRVGDPGSRAPVRSRDPSGSPPTTRTRQGAPSVTASSTARRLSSSAR